MKALLLHSENSAVGQYRIWRPAKWLERQGWEIVRLPDDIPKSIAIDHTDHKKGGYCFECLMDGVDLIVMQRSDRVDLLPLVLAMADIQKCPIVYDIDDNIYDISPSSPAYEHFYPGSPLIQVAEEFMRYAHALTVSTPALKEAYSHLNDNIYVLPNAQDLEEWPEPNQEHEGLVIGWAGGVTHYDDLKMIWRPLKKILRNNPEVKFKVWGLRADFLEDHPQVEYVEETVHCTEFPQTLAKIGFDVGIVPVVNRPFNLGKSNIKWQEYSMAGIPTIASKTGEYKVIEHGVTGILADSEESWYFWMEKLMRETKLRLELAANAKRYVSEHYNIAVGIKEYERAYGEILRTFWPLSS